MAGIFPAQLDSFDSSPHSRRRRNSQTAHYEDQKISAHFGFFLYRIRPTYKKTMDERIGSSLLSTHFKYRWNEIFRYVNWQLKSDGYAGAVIVHFCVVGLHIYKNKSDSTLMLVVVEEEIGLYSASRSSSNALLVP